MVSRFFLNIVLVVLIAQNSATAQPGNNIDPFHYSSRKKVECTHGAVVSAHPLASDIGVEILKEGGNAFDAAIATQFALAVVYPAAGNIGGGGFMVARTAEGKNVAIDFREKAPGKASRDMYLDANGNAQPDRSQNGHLSTGVPGSVAGIFKELLFAKLPLKKLIQPAIDLAENGFAVTEPQARSLNSEQGEFRKYNTELPVFVREKPWKKGDTLVQKDLAQTLIRIRENGLAGFYQGETAKLIIDEMQRGNGIITGADLLSYQAIDREAVNSTYRNVYMVITMPLPSSGGVLLPLMLNMVEEQPLTNYGYGSLKSVHLMTEVERLAYADRAKYLGDKDYYEVPISTLTSRRYAKERMKLFDPDKAGTSEKIQSGSIPAESKQTTHFETYDQDGNAVSITTTLNNSYGSKTVVGGAGFFLNDEMDDFSIKPGVPNMYGAVGGDANAIAPGKRMLSSMTPTIVLKGGKPFLIVGTPGGTTITTSVFQTVLDIIDFGLTPQDAVNKPKFHHQWLPDEIIMERDFNPAIIEQLKHMGYKIRLTSEIGRTEVIEILSGNRITAVGDKRGEDTAAGY
ncbi:MAG TPA: gamma-glutamyltransferase [Puia sp.]|nr:gamma-glutamyltransferase [Puia sp.]